MSRQIVFTAINKAEFLTTEDPELKCDQVRVRTIVSTISNGTERANITGDPNVSISRTEEIPLFPRFSGYSSAGEIIELGSNVTGFSIGDRVAMSWSKHKEINTLSADRISRIPADISYEEAALCHIATFPLAAIRKTRLELGESMMVMGLGILGLIAIQLGKAAGAVPIIAADPNPARREKALKLGADYALDPFAPNFSEQVMTLTGGIKVAIEVTGAGAALNETLDCMARFGRVALLGCTRDENFTVDYYRKVHGPGITLIGAHTMARPQQDSFPGWFSEKEDRDALLKLLAGKRLDFKALIDETYSPAECTEVYKQLVEDKNFPAVVQFDWRTR